MTSKKINSRRKLSSLKKGEGGLVIDLEKNSTSLHLMEMGILPGEYIMVDTIAPLGDPMSIKVGAYLLSLRKDEASSVFVEVQ